MSLKKPVMTDPVEKLQVKETKAAFVDIMGKAVDKQSIVIEGNIKCRIAYIGPENIIHHHEETIPFSHLIKTRLLYGRKGKLQIGVHRPSSKIEHSLCRLNSQLKKMEISMILKFFINIKEDGQIIDSFEERTLITNPLDIHVPRPRPKKQESLEQPKRRALAPNPLKEKRDLKRKELREDLADTKSSNANAKLLNQWKVRVKRELEEEFKEEMRKEIQEILPSLKENILQEMENRQKTLENERRERIQKKSMEQSRRGYRGKENSFLNL